MSHRYKVNRIEKNTEYYLTMMYITISAVFNSGSSGLTSPSFMCGSYRFIAMKREGSGRAGVEGGGSRRGCGVSGFTGDQWFHLITVVSPHPLGRESTGNRSTKMEWQSLWFFIEERIMFSLAYRNVAYYTKAFNSQQCWSYFKFYIGNPSEMSDNMGDLTK